MNLTCIKRYDLVRTVPLTHTHCGINGYCYSILSIFYNLFTLTCTVPHCPFSSSRLVPVTVIRSPRLSGKEGGEGADALTALSKALSNTPPPPPALSALPIARPVAPDVILRDASGFTFNGFTTEGRAEGEEHDVCVKCGDESYTTQ